MTFEAIRRPYALRFVVGADGDQVVNMLNGWNEALTAFPGTGFFDFRPEYEIEHGIAQECYYLHADSEFWNAFQGMTESPAPYVEEVVLAGEPGLAVVYA